MTTGTSETSPAQGAARDAGRVNDSQLLAPQVRIGVVGDYLPDNETHQAIAASVDHHGRLGVIADVVWMPTDLVASRGPHALDAFDALWIAPGSPYRSLEGAPAAIRHARVGDVPLLGTCGGFQHVVLEYARNMLGFADAHHAEYDPYASQLFITALSCSLVGTTMQVRLEAGSRAAEAYGATSAVERYYCNFGLNPAHEAELLEGGLAVTGRDADGEARVVELPGHPFFVATLYVPQTSSTADAPHPLVGAFLVAARARRSVGELPS
jgi:CTP synthase (UTP-ammonia lyase)